MKSKIFLKSVVSVMTLLLFIIPVVGQAASDWPMWRYNANRSASSPAGLPDQLYLQWGRQYAPRTMVWDDPLNQDLMPYDKVFEPIVVGNIMFLGFNDTDKIVALDTDTGEEIWSFYTDGPIRFPGVVSNGKVYFGSDDGCLYCLHASSGELAWKFQAAPKERKLLGNLRLISTWAVRGGPVIENGVVYFAAGPFPVMGVFIYALDAETGEVIWLNDGEGSRWTLMPHHGSEAFAGVAPQGSLTISGNSLIIPSGRAVPASFNKNTGEYQYYRIQEFQKTGGSFTAATDDLFVNHYREGLCSIYDTKTGLGLLGQIGRYPVIDGNTIYTSKGKTVFACDISGIEALAKQGPPKVTEELKKEPLAPGYTPFYIGYKPETVDEKGFQNQALAIWKKAGLWTISADASGDLIKAGNCLYAADGNSITAINVKGKPSIAWVIKLDGPVGRLVAANGKLFAVTLDGRILAFGGKEVKPNLILNKPIASGANIKATKEALSIIEKSGVSEGYALVYGIGDGALLEALVNNSGLDIIAVDPDKAKVEEIRQRFDAIGIYGKRLAVIQGTPLTLNAPQYMASLTIVNKGKLDSKTLNALYFSMRPYGGKVLFRTEPGNLKSLVSAAGLSKLKVVGDYLISREGALEGSDSFTHAVGDVANTGVVNDDLVKPPLGILWWGAGTNNLNVLPRHAHGPTEQVIGGRLYIEGIDRITCRDVYTGREIWQERFNDMETYDIYYSESYKETPLSTRYNQEHLPGVKLRGTNYIATEDIVYVVNAYPQTREGWKVDMMDAATGKLLGHIDLPKIPYRAYDKVRKLNQQWGYIGVSKDLLIGGGELVAFSDLTQLTKAEKGHEYYWADWDIGASKSLFIMDRYSGKIKWNIESKISFLHTGIVAGGGMLFALDKFPPGVIDQLEKKGKDIPAGGRIIALDINTGKVLWEDTKSTVFGSYLLYSEEYDILLQSTHPSRDCMVGETGNRMVAYRASTGKVLWDVQKGKDEKFLYFQFPLLHHDTIITSAKQQKAEGRHFSLLTGERLDRKSPMTGSDVELRWARRYGCNYALGAEHLLTFRSGCAGYFDLNQDSGTGSFGGFKSGCTNSLAVADGVLSSPDYTRTCVCSYPNQTSLALVYMPENEIWTFNELDLDEAPIKTIGLNLGAHGDRVADSGMWWFDYPIVGGPSPKIPAKTSPAEPKYFRHHSMRFEGELPWVASSGCEGLSSLTLGQTKGSYTVRLYFAEPDDYILGQRVFDVALQGKTVLSKLDVVAAAGKARKTVVKEFKNVWANDKGELVVTFKPLTSAGPIINGIEVIAETTITAAK